MPPPLLLLLLLPSSSPHSHSRLLVRRVVVVVVSRARKSARRGEGRKEREREWGRASERAVAATRRRSFQLVGSLRVARSHFRLSLSLSLFGESAISDLRRRNSSCSKRIISRGIYIRIRECLFLFKRSFLFLILSLFLFLLLLFFSSSKACLFSFFLFRSRPRGLFFILPFPSKKKPREASNRSRRDCTAREFILLTSHVYYTPSLPLLPRKKRIVLHIVPAKKSVLLSPPCC